MLKTENRSRWIPFTVAGALTAVAALTGLGLYLTTAQIQQLEKVLFDTTVDGARGRLLPAIDGGLRELETRGLDALEAFARERGPFSDERLVAVRRRHPFIDLPFFLAVDGRTTIFPPAARSTDEVSPLLADEIPPEDYRRALAALWQGESGARSTASLLRLHDDPELPARWRLGALNALATQNRREGRFEEAVRIYDRVFAEFESELSGGSTPSRLQLVLCRAEAHAAGGRTDLAAASLQDVLEGLAEGRIRPASPAEEGFFIARARAMIVAAARVSNTRETPRADLSAVLARYQERRDREEFRDLLGRLLVGRIRLLEDYGDTGSGEAAHLSEVISGDRRVVTWRSGTSRLREIGLGAVGFSVDPNELRQLIENVCSAELPGEEGAHEDGSGALPFRLIAGDVDTTDRPTIALDRPLDFLRVGVEEGAWRERLRRARRPLILAAFLIPALGLGMLLAIVMFYRGYRRAELLSRLKTDFVANVSHELKTPLALIRMFGETLLLGRIPDEGRKARYYEIITRESERLTHLINNVLDFASIESGRKEYDLEPIDLGSVIRETMASYRYQLEDKGFRIHQEIPDDLPTTLADRNAVAQALINLVNNAVKYSPDRKDIRVDVRTSGQSISVRVSDQGVGIPAEDQERIFEGFYRTRDAVRLGRRGSGLGLSLVQHIMASHGGHVTLESAPGHGSTFTLIFPVRGAAASHTDRPDGGGSGQDE